ncbi:MAG: hypothetical protein K0S32_1227 [Bacteroidetes bacterium]|jgi:hypothetical protein|nr:hypothetical protein [Bacteroidota bacterium]
MKNKLLYIILLSLFCLTAHPGELEDLLKLSKTYSSDNLSLEFKLDMNYSNQKKQSYTGKYLKNKKGFYYSVIHIESFSDDVNSVVIDKDQKLIVVGNSLSSDKTGDEIKNMLSQFKFDSADVKNRYDLKYIANTNKLKKIAMNLKDEESEFESIEVTLMEDYTLSEIRYKFRKSTARNYVTDYTITYTKQKLSGAVSIPVKLSNYIVLNGNSIKPVKAYEGYKLVDNRYKYK